MKPMKTHLSSRIAVLALCAVGVSLQACGGAPEAQPVEKSSQDLSILGVTIPQPTVTVSSGDNSVTINPIGVVDQLVPDGGVKIPDPLTPVNQIIGALDNGVSVGITAPGIELGGTIGLPIPLPELPDPFDGGITVIGK
jgi:hypothetical protein